MAAAGLGSAIASGGPLTTGLVLSVAVLAPMLISTFIPLQVGFWLGCALNTFQLYAFPIGTFYPSFSMLGWLTTWRAPLSSGGLWRWRWMQALALLFAVQTISLAWSPDPVLGVRNIIYSLPMLLAAHTTYRLAMKHPDLLRKAITLLLSGSAVEAALVVIFRVLPSVESAFLRGSVGRLFISGNVLDQLFTAGGGNNVLADDKAGGFFVNGNVASAFLGVCAILSWYCAKGFKSRLLILVRRVRLDRSVFHRLEGWGDIGRCIAALLHDCLCPAIAAIQPAVDWTRRRCHRRCSSSLCLHVRVAREISTRLLYDAQYSPRDMALRAAYGA